MGKKEIAIIEDVAKKLLGLLEVKAEVTVTPGEEIVDVVLETEEGGILIGHHGETLEALQLVLSLCAAKELDKFVRISLEIGDYKKNRMDWIKHTVEQTKERVLAEKQAISLPYLKAWERRVVHMLLQDDTEVISESTGEGRERTLTIAPKQQG